MYTTNLTLFNLLVCRIDFSRLLYESFVRFEVKFLNMAATEKQRICIKFCVALGETSTETYQLLQTAFGEEISHVSL